MESTFYHCDAVYVGINSFLIIAETIQHGNLALLCCLCGVDIADVVLTKTTIDLRKDATNENKDLGSKGGFCCSCINNVKGKAKNIVLNETTCEVNYKVCIEVFLYFMNVQVSYEVRIEAQVEVHA